MLGSCTATIKSYKPAAFHKKIERIYVVAKIAENSRGFSTKFETKFRALMSTKGIHTDFELLNLLVVDAEKDLKDRIDNSNADALMVITQTESVTYTSKNIFYSGSSAYRKAADGTFDIRMYQPNDEHPIWEGRLKVTSLGYNAIGSVANLSAKKVVENLIRDKVI